MKFVKYLSWSTLIFCSILIVLALDKGFDLTDEGLYLLHFNQFDYTLPSVLFYPLTYKMLFGWVEPNILNLRILKLVLIFFSSLLLAGGLNFFLRSRNLTNPQFSWVTYPLVFAGAVIAFSFGPKSLSYNSMTSIFMAIAIGMLFFQAAKPWGGFVRIFLPTTVGFFSMMVLFSKVSAGLGFLLMVGLGFFIFRTKPKEVILDLLFFIFGCISALFLFSVVNQNFLILWKNFLIAKNVIQNADLGYSYMSFFNNIVQTGIRAIDLLLVSFFLWSFTLLGKQYLKFQLGAVIGYIALFFITLVFYWRWQNNISYFFILIGYLFLNVFNEREVSLKSLKCRKNLTFLYFGIILFISPFISGLGSNNPLFIQTVYTMNLWFALLAFGINFSKKQLFVSITLVAAFSMTLSWFVRNHVFFPYRGVNVFKNEFPLKVIKGNERVKIEAKTHSFLLNVKRTLEKAGYEKGDTILGLQRMPGLIYLLEGHAFGGFDWGGPVPASIFVNSTNGFLVQKQKPQWIIVNNDSRFKSSNKDAFEILERIELSLSDYDHLGNVLSDYPFLRDISIYTKRSEP